ncbi:MAG: hypothetical protein JSR47_02030 [Proteobacteria bacterium]|nr:hypothetical protein [Pseudomonadota bacterium]
MTHLHHGNCGCLPRLSRRGLIGAGFASAMVAAFPALAAGKNYEAMLVNCIDPRFTTSSFAYMAGRGFKDSYSQFVIAGGPIAVVADTFKDWRKTFWDNLDITVKLHNIQRVVGVTHRDCGAAAVVYGDRIMSDFGFETEKHTEALRAFRAEIGKRHPKLAVDTGIMSLDGAVTVVT